MAQSVRAKFAVSAVTRFFYDGRESQSTQITLTPQYDNTIDEDRRFARSTPSGSIVLSVDNPSAAAFLTAHKLFYVDFVPVAPVAAQ